MKVLRADLRYAGIVESDSRGRLDFHATRKALANMMASKNVSQRITQAHLRHTDPRLTAGIYTDEHLLPIAGEIARLPALPTVRQDDPQRMRVTGTYDLAAPQQRAQAKTMQNDVHQCAEATDGVNRADEAQLVDDSRTCNAEHGSSKKRVMGLEPTTFTLAT